MAIKTKRAEESVREVGPSATFAPQTLDLQSLRRKRNAAKKSREADNKHTYFIGVAEARYVLRKAFRIVEDQAKAYGIDPLAHQALIQIYGSSEMQLQVNQIANRLDIPAAFASTLARTLVEKGLAERRRDDQDQRVTYVAVTDSGRELLHAIDEKVQFHVDYFASQLTSSERESALSILMFYVGAKF
ncbi:MarR family transcriptional regulator [Bradyrhizobium sp. 190]|uniref:MarR family winged helix-turn-helix transcriptional regulator n=1 Tax=Bradyrhizobium sp. 190 TaxID=2782658 RepID=UPI001FF9260B|nr:MarR family transcriptional regulator [Bradyrhizobium sp. 190]MCK1513162.1 MarR family transcriptional regulator [Bradyrhizobium sp. 190]